MLLGDEMFSEVALVSCDCFVKEEPYDAGGGGKVASTKKNIAVYLAT